MQYSTSNIVNCVFWNNTDSGIYNYNASPIVQNCIIWNNTPFQIAMGIGSPIIKYCDVEGGVAGEGNIESNPLFADPENGDFHLFDESPCIDAGNNSAPSLPSNDFEGDPRILDGDGDLMDISFLTLQLDHS